MNFFVNDKLFTYDLIAVDYFHDECLMGTVLAGECLLVSMYVYYFKLMQPNNFNFAYVAWFPIPQNVCTFAKVGVTNAWTPYEINWAQPIWAHTMVIKRDHRE